MLLSYFDSTMILVLRPERNESEEIIAGNGNTTKQ